MSGAVHPHGVGFESAGNARPAPSSHSAAEGAGSDRQRRAMRTAIRAVCPKLELAFRLLDQDRIRSCIALAQAFTLGNVLDHRHYVLAERTSLLGDVQLAKYQSSCTVRGVHVSALGPLGRAWESGSVQVAQDVSGLPSEVHPLCTLRAARCWNASIAEVVYIPVHDADGSAWRRAGGGDGPACGVLAVIELFLRPGGDGTALPAAISAAHHALDAAGLSMSPVEEDQVVAIGDVADPEPARAAAAAAGGAAAPAPAPTPVPASSAASASVATAADSGDSDANDASSARIEPRASAFASSSSSRAVSEPRACRGPRSVRFEQDRDGTSSGSPHTPLSTTGDAHLEFLEFRSGAAVDAFEDGAAACRADDPCEGLARAGGLGGRSRSVGARVSPPVSPESPQPFDRIAADGQGAKLAPRRAGGLVRTRSAHALRVDLDD